MENIELVAKTCHRHRLCCSKLSLISWRLLDHYININPLKGVVSSFMLFLVFFQAFIIFTCNWHKNFYKQGHLSKCQQTAAHIGQIQHAAYFCTALELRMLFKFLCGWTKSNERSFKTYRNYEIQISVSIIELLLEHRPVDSSNYCLRLLSCYSGSID